MKKITLIFTLILILSSCNQSVKSKEKSDNESYTPISHADMENAVIYEVNIRQYTPEGTFNAFEKHLPRLKEMGVDILWLMPVQPIGKVKRKGILGSYYSISDFS